MAYTYSPVYDSIAPKFRGYEMKMTQEVLDLLAERVTLGELFVYFDDELDEEEYTRLIAAARFMYADGLDFMFYDTRQGDFINIRVVDEARASNLGGIVIAPQGTESRLLLSPVGGSV